MTRSRLGQRRKVDEATRVVQRVLGDAARRDLPQGVKYFPTTKAPKTQPKNDAIAVLTLKEAAVRLGISTSETEAMVTRGAVKSLMAGWTVVVPTSEVVRLRAVGKEH